MLRMQVSYSRKSSKICRDFLLAERRHFSNGSKHKAGSIQFGQTNESRKAILLSVEAPSSYNSLRSELERSGCFVYPYAPAYLAFPFVTKN